MSDVAIRATNLCKRFKLYDDMITGPVKELIFFWRRRDFFQEFPAVNDVSFEIKRGEVVGIVGPNGAGKSTLLKMIAGLLNIDGGTLEVNGRVTALLALGVGVHPEFTGRENIFYGAMLLGMSKREVLGKMDSIIEFAELGDYIDRPFRTYSSGMRARLLFSISMSIDPDILIVDEALATGDSYFVQKCLRRIREICQGGATILFVSHNLQQVKTLCRRAFLMHNGYMLKTGESDSILEAYSDLAFQQADAALRKDAGEKSSVPLTEPVPRGRFEVLGVEMLAENGTPKLVFRTWETVDVKISYRHNYPEAIDVDMVLLFTDEATGRIVAVVDPFEAFGDGDVESKAGPVHVDNEGAVLFRLSPLLVTGGNFNISVKCYKDGDLIGELMNSCRFFAARGRIPFYHEIQFLHPATVRHQTELDIST
jgi:ABC-type polysaccharide/polyol phosphate transport system ATPase subunit